MRLAVWLDAAATVALAGALALLAWPRDHVAGRVLVPMLAADDAPGALRAPGADARALRARAVALGEVITIEDLVRVIAAGEAKDLPPERRAAVRERLATARAHVDALLALETAQHVAEDRLDAAGREIGAALTPEQRAWILQHRDATSVSGVEAPYWDAAKDAAK